MSYQESGRQHLAPNLLRIVDLNGIRYSEMQPGQQLRIYAQDAVSRESGSFVVEVLNVRPVEPPSPLKTATLRYAEGNFLFWDGDDTSKTTKIPSGTLMENGISGSLYPQLDVHMTNFGGIGLGRDHSFEYVNGTEVSIIAHTIEMIDIKSSPKGYEPPDISDHLQRVAAVREQYKQNEVKRAELVRRVILGDIDELFSAHPEYQQIRDMLADYSSNGMIVMESYLRYAFQDGVLDKAWELLKQTHKSHFEYDPPMFRGDLDFKDSTRWAFARMMRESGIKWPRPGRE